MFDRVSRYHVEPLRRSGAGRMTCATGPAAAQEVHLVPIPPDTMAGPDDAPPVTPPGPEVELSRLVLPAEPCRVSLCPTPSASDAADAPGGEPCPSIVLEIVRHQTGQPRVIVLRPAHARLRVNGAPASRIAVLKERDCFQWGDGPALQVCVYHRPNLGAPPPEALGRECPVCRVPFSADARCYVCACGMVMHCEDDRKGGLECAQLRASIGCPSCRRPVVLQACYGHLPEVGCG